MLCETATRVILHVTVCEIAFSAMETNCIVVVLCVELLKLARPLQGGMEIGKATFFISWYRHFGAMGTPLALPIVTSVAYGP